MKFYFFQGTITMIEDFWTGVNGEGAGCNKLMSVQNGQNLVNFVVTPTTYFVNHEIVSVGDLVTGFYDANAPTPLIFPPQYQAIVMARFSQYRNVKVDYFDSQLLSSDNSLKLHITPYTRILLENGQPFTSSPANRNLIVVYGATTKSIPAQTTPIEIIVMCCTPHGLTNETL